MSESLRILLSRVVDYAGLFPPAALTMGEAVPEYLGHQGAQHAWMLSHFICTAAQLPAFEKELPHSAELSLSVLGAGGPDTDSWMEQTRRDLALCASLEERHEGKLKVLALEAPLPESVRIAPEGAPVRDWIKDLHATVAESRTSVAQVFLETPPGVGEGAKINWLFNILGLSELEDKPVIGVKLRTGGLEPAAFPSPRQVADFMHAAWKNDLIFKCTAGLHHPFRHWNDDIGCEMHGFLNVFAGAALLAAGKVSRDALEELLADQTPASFSFSDDDISWQGNSCGLDTLKATRRAFSVSFGSCSFQEPIDDLTSLGLL